MTLYNFKGSISKNQTFTYKFFCLILFFSTVVFTASASVQDSLQRLLRKSSGTTKVLLLVQLSASYIETKNNQEAFVHGREAWQLASQLHFNYGEDASLNALGCYFRGINQNDSAISYFQRALIAEQNTDSLSLKGNIFINLGIVYIRISKYDIALNYFQQAKAIGQQLKDNLLQAKALNYCGQIYFFKSNYTNALDDFLKAKRLVESMHNQLMLAQTIYSIGIIYLNTSQYPLSLSYFNQALSLYLAIDNKEGIGNCYSEMGNVLSDQKRYREGNVYYFKALNIFKKLGDKYYLSVLDNNLGDNYLILKEYQSAKNLYEQSLQISAAIQDEEGVIYAHINIGNAYVGLHDWHAAQKHLELGRKMADNNKLLKLQRLAYESIFKMNESRGNYKAALTAFKRFVQLNDSMVNEDVLNHLSELQTKYETEKKTHQIQVQQLSIRNQKHVLWASVGFAIFLLCVLVVVILLWRKRNVAYRKLVELNRHIAENEIKNLSLESQNQIPKEESAQYASSQLNPELKAQIAERINRYMIDQQPYLKFNFNLDDLTKAMETNRTYLSQIIHEEYKCGFTRFVNDFRIREACRIMANPQYDKAIKALHEKVGFSSQSAFYDAFKIKTGTTPSFYYKQVRQSDESSY